MLFRSETLLVTGGAEPAFEAALAEALRGQDFSLAHVAVERDTLFDLVALGFGLAVTVAPLTSTVLDAVPAEHAGIASAVNNDVARAAALIAVALLPEAGGITGDAYRHANVFSAGFHTASLISGALCVAGGVLAVFTIRNPVRVAGADQPTAPPIHCALDAPPVAVTGSARP